VGITLRWVRENLLHVLIGTAAVLAVAAAVVWVITERGRMALEARDALAEIQKEARDIPAADSEKRRELALQLADHCDALAIDYARSDAAPSALMLAGQMLAALDEPGAQDYFRRVVEMRSAPAGLRDLAARALAGSLESAGDYSEAIVEYEKILAGASGNARDQARWDIARCREMTGDMDSARRDYAALAAGNQDNPWAQLARTRILFLDNPPRPFAAAVAGSFRGESRDSLFGIPLKISDLVGIPDNPVGEASRKPLSIPSPEDATEVPSKP